jgi:hypothetical protein
MVAFVKTPPPILVRDLPSVLDKLQQLTGLSWQASSKSGHVTQVMAIGKCQQRFYTLSRHPLAGYTAMAELTVIKPRGSIEACCRAINRHAARVRGTVSRQRE